MYLYIINFKNNIDMKDFIRETDNVTYGTFSHLNGMGVYQIRCKSENKAYIGSSTNCQDRVQKHFSELRLNRHTNKRLQDAFNKYGFEDFICSIVIYVNNQDNLLDLETNYQKKLGIDNIYNDKISGYYITDELREIRANSIKALIKQKNIELKWHLLSKLKRLLDVIMLPVKFFLFMRIFMLFKRLILKSNVVHFFLLVMAIRNQLMVISGNMFL